MHEVSSMSDFVSQQKAAAGKICVVDFYATWCGPCKAVAPKYQEISQKYSKEAHFLKLDVDKVKDVAQDANVKSLPSFGFYHQGKLLDLQVGGDVLSLEAKIQSLSAKHSTYAFMGKGNSLMGGSSGAGAANSSAASTAQALANTKAIGVNAPSQPAGASSGRRNPWADPNFGLAKAALGSGAAAPAPAAAAAKPAAKPAAAAAPVAAAKPVPAAAPASVAKPVAATPAAKPAAAAVVPAAKPQTAAAAPAAAATTPAAAAAPASTAAAAVPAAAAAASTAAAPAPAAAPVAAAAAAAPAAAAPASASAAAGELASAAAAASAAAPKPAGNDPALTKNLNKGFLDTLSEMGFPRIRVEKALILTGNKGVQQALDWMTAHENDADVDEPLAVVGSAAKPPPNMDDMTDEEITLYEAMQARKAAKGINYAGGANEADPAAAAGSGKVSTLQMTSEEKMAWLNQRRAEVKAQKEAAAIEAIKEAERNRKKHRAEASKTEELMEAQQRKAADDAIRKKKKEEEDKKKARAAILAKLEEDKKRRKEQAERQQAELEAIRAAKAAAANK